MKVFLAAIGDCTQQSYQLAKAMREYLGWNARSFLQMSSYLQYPTDWWGGNREDVEAAKEFATDADLYIFQDMIFTPPRFGHDFFKKGRLTPKNTIVHGQGTIMREQLPALQDLQRRGWHIIPPLSDPTLARYLGGAPFEAWIVPIEEINELTKGIERNEEYTFVYSPTKINEEEEKTIRQALKGLPCELIEITRTPWTECIKTKAQAHCVINSLTKESYGLNCLEGMAMGQVVISRITPWDYCLHADLPIISTAGKDLRKILKQTITDRDRHFIQNRINYARDWIETYFSPQNVVNRWYQYIKWAIEEQC